MPAIFFNLQAADIHWNILLQLQFFSNSSLSFSLSRHWSWQEDGKVSKIWEDNDYLIQNWRTLEDRHGWFHSGNTWVLPYQFYFCMNLVAHTCPPWWVFFLDCCKQCFFFIFVKMYLFWSLILCLHAVQYFSESFWTNFTLSSTFANKQPCYFNSGVSSLNKLILLFVSGIAPEGIASHKKHWSSFAELL